MAASKEKEAIYQYLQQNGDFRTLFGIDIANMQSIYAYGYHLYNSGNYPDAKRLFMLLARLSYREFDYWLALGLTCQKLAEYNEAIYCFGRATLIDFANPKPVYLAGLTFILVDNTDSANMALASAIKLCGRQQGYMQLKEEIQKLLDSLQKEYPNDQP